MPSNYTENYHLSQWVKTDKVLMDDFNADNLAIDAALAGKAESSALDALNQRVDGLAQSKADASAQTSLSQTVSEHTAALKKKGNCVIHTQTYPGTGGSGSSNPTVINFPGKPLLVVIYAADGAMIVAPNGAGTVTYRSGSISTTLTAAWSGNSLRVHSKDNPTAQMNSQYQTYSVIAFLAADA